MEENANELLIMLQSHLLWQKPQKHVLWSVDTEKLQINNNWHFVAIKKN